VISFILLITFDNTSQHSTLCVCVCGWVCVWVCVCGVCVCVCVCTRALVLGVEKGRSYWSPTENRNALHCFLINKTLKSPAVAVSKLACDLWYCSSWYPVLECHGPPLHNYWNAYFLFCGMLKSYKLLSNVYRRGVCFWGICGWGWGDMTGRC